MRRFGSRAGVGASSVMLIVVMLCLTLFGALAALSAKNDATLTARTLAHTEAFYAADAALQARLAALDGALLAGDAPEADAVLENGDLLLTADAGDGRRLEAVIRRSGGGSARYAIMSYRVESAGEWNPDTGWQLVEP